MKDQETMLKSEVTQTFLFFYQIQHLLIMKTLNKIKTGQDNKDYIWGWGTKANTIVNRKRLMSFHVRLRTEQENLVPLLLFD